MSSFWMQNLTEVLMQEIKHNCPYDGEILVREKAQSKLKSNIHIT